MHGNCLVGCNAILSEMFIHTSCQWELVWHTGLKLNLIQTQVQSCLSNIAINNYFNISSYVLAEKKIKFWVFWSHNPLFWAYTNYLHGIRLHGGGKKNGGTRKHSYKNQFLRSASCPFVQIIQWAPMIFRLSSVKIQLSTVTFHFIACFL